MVVANPRHGNEPLHGVPMTTEMFESIIGMESPYHYELIDGLLYNMSGGSAAHAEITANITELLRRQLGKTGPYRVYQEQYVTIPDYPSVQLDVTVTCNLADRTPEQLHQFLKIRSPLIAIEVLSESTEKIDRGEKFARYIHSPTLRVYVMVSQWKRHIEVYRRDNGWREELYTDNQTAQLDVLDLELPPDEVYEGVF